MGLLAAPPSALNSAVPFTRPISSPIQIPNSGVLLGGISALGLIIGTVELIGELGANKWRDDLLSKVTGRKSVSVDNGNNQGNQPIDPNTVYKWYVPINGNANIGYGYLLHTGTYESAVQVKSTYFPSVPPYPVFAGSEGNFPPNANQLTGIKPALTSDPQTQVTSGLASGKESKSSQGISAPPSIFGSVPSSVVGTVGLLGTTQAPPTVTPPNTTEEKKLPPPPELLKSPPPPEPPPPSREERQVQEEEKKTEREKEEEKQKERQEEQKRIVPPPPATGDTNRILQELIRVGSISALIRANTEPQAQRSNSKNGACDALNSPSCTKGVEDRIKDPINNKVDDVAGKVAATASSLDLIKNVADNSFKFISRIYNNQFVHSSLSFMTTMTTIHNAAMLSRDVAETLGTVVDNSVNLSGQKLKDADGNDISFTSWIGTNIRALIVQLIGADKYVQLALQWQKANTIYHSAMAVVNTTQSMLDPISSAVEYGMENVSKIGNGLREDGVVSENSYPAMDETIRARRVNRFERLNDTLEGAENISSNLSSITSSAVSVKEDFKQLREDQKQLRDQAANFNTADEQARAELKASLPTQITPLNLTPAPEEGTP